MAFDVKEKGKNRGKFKGDVTRNWGEVCAYFLLIGTFEMVLKLGSSSISLRVKNFEKNNIVKDLKNSAKNYRKLYVWLVMFFLTGLI